MDIADVVLSLTGPVEPVGDSAMDAHRLENLRALCDVAGVLLDRIELVSEAYGEHMASVKAARDHAAAFLRTRGVQASGCCRSHPHENMNAECERLTVIAREQNAAASGVTVDRHQTFCTDTPTGERAKD